MLSNRKSVDLTPQQINVIEAALHTQEKILSMQSRVGEDDTSRARLHELQSVLNSFQRQARPKSCLGWAGKARALLG